MELATVGDSPRGVQRLDAALAKTPLSGIFVGDRPYFSVARTYARLGRPERARGILADYARDVRDTALKRSQEPALHETLGEIALAENKPTEAITEFDMAPDGPANACRICIFANLGRAFDAAHQSDSAIVMYENFIKTPYFERMDIPLFVDFVDPADPTYLPGIHRRLGELYESKGDTAKAVEHYRAFVELWKNADPEVQPRVTEVKRRLTALTPVERTRKGGSR